MDAMPVAVQRPPEPETRTQGEQQVRVCLMSLGGELYAIDLNNVSEVFQVESVTRVPGMPSAMMGVANLRGVIVPLLDLRHMLGLTVDGSPLPFAVVIRHGSRQVGVLVDRVPEIRTIRMDQFLPAIKTSGTTSRPFVSAVLRLDERLGGVLEVPIVFEQVEGRGTAPGTA